MEYHLLPSELKFNILSRVPAESLFQLRCVCKSWQTLVDDPFFRKIHTDRLLIESSSSSTDTPVNVTSFQKFSNETKQFSGYTFRFAEFHINEHEQLQDDEFSSIYNEEVDDEFSHCYKVSKPITTPPGYEMGNMNIIWSSCNGLICLFKYNPVVFNPLTKECMFIPHPKNRSRINAWGFGYHPSSKEYKVVAMFKYQKVSSERPTQHILVHTVGRRNWRYKGEVPKCFNYCNVPAIPGVLVNGVLHWFDLNGVIVAFDLLTERFGSVNPPPPFTGLSVFDFYNAKLSLGVARNSLTVTRHKGCQYIEMWMLMNNNSSSWTKVFNIPIFEESAFCQAIKYERCLFTTVMKSGKILFCFCGMMASYDPKKDKLSTHKYTPLIDAMLHTNSFVSLKHFKRFEEIQSSKNIDEEGNSSFSSSLLL